MNKDHETKIPDEESSFSQQVRAQAARKLKARRDGARSVWFGLGMSGLVGWSVTVPTLAGAAIGVWADRRYPSSYSWTLMLLLAGLILGCLNAWHWVSSEFKAIQENGDA